MTDLNRIRKLAGVPLMEAEQETWTPSAEELAAEREREEEERQGALDAEADARYDLEARIEKNVVYAFTKVGIDLIDGHNIYFDDEETIEAQVDYDVNGIPLEKLVALSQSGIGSNFSVAPSGDHMMIRFKVDINLASARPTE